MFMLTGPNQPVGTVKGNQRILQLDFFLPAGDSASKNTNIFVYRARMQHISFASIDWVYTTFYRGRDREAGRSFTLSAAPVGSTQVGCSICQLLA